LPPASASHAISVRGAREHNLKNVDVDIPRDQLVVITGLSGSGKSSLAFDTIYAEGQRRYVESLSAYARQFLELMQKPDVDSIEGLSPAISIEQKTTSKNPRSTVGTVTEIYDYLRLLYARIGIPYSPATGLPIESQTVSQMVDRIMALPEGSRIYLLAPIVRGRKGEYKKELQDLQKRGFQRVRVDGQVYEIAEAPNLNKKLKHDIEVVVDRVAVKAGIETRLANSVETALGLADGLLFVDFADTPPKGVPGITNGRILFSAKFACPVSGFTIDEIEPRLFSFNNPFGACPVCDGLGSKLYFDPELVVPDSRKSLRDGAVAPWANSSSQYYNQTLDSLARHYKFSLGVPWAELPKRIRDIILFGSGNEAVTLTFDDGTRSYKTTKPFEGVITNMDRRFRETDSSWVREELGRYQASSPCDACNGQRLKPEALAVKIDGLNIAQVTDFSIAQAAAWFGALNAKLTPKQQDIAYRILKEINERLGFLNSVGLDYLTLSRASATLSGGEVVARGTPKQVMATNSLTAQYLNGTRSIAVPDQRRTGLNGSAGGKDMKLRIVGAKANNLKNVTVDIPLGVLTCVTGVSGGGKSTLIIETLYNALARRLHDARTHPGAHDRIEGLEFLDKVIDIDQSPIGRTPRSNPATYTGAFTPIRDWFAGLPEAQARGYKAGRFSFNVKGGRCEACEGDGVIKIEMHFLPDVYVQCDQCKGKRYNRETLEIHFKGKSIADVLDMTVEEGAEFFKAVPPIRDKLAMLEQVGLGYIHVGQAATTLSGGEAQRVKLSRELARRATGRTLYILDEPTTGLHFEDVRKLLEVIHKLVDQGNTVVVIEHNLEVIKTADWIIDLGPEGGDKGGRVVAAGTPEQVAATAGSYTGQYLAPHLNGRVKKKRA
jgi:excinuclease UvrABC ATPase subunit